MKKHIVALFAVLVLLMALIPMQAMAASYPFISTDKTACTPTIQKGYIGMLSMDIWPVYTNERCVVVFMDSNGKTVGQDTRTLYNTKIGFREHAVPINTRSMNLKVGTYTAKYWMEYYSYGRWNEAPSTYTYTFKVIENKCNSNHKYKKTSTYTAATCTSKGKDVYTCSVCGFITYKESAMKSHKYSLTTVTLKPTPTSAGSGIYTCNTCTATKTKEIPISAAVKITTQPKNKTVSAGESAKFTVEATGDGLTYQWYFKDAGADAWEKSSVTKASYTTTMKAERDGRELYCLVTDMFGNEEASKTVKLKLPALKITTQPKDAGAYVGEKAKVTVKATGDGVKYTWYYKNAGASEYTKSTTESSTYSLKMTEERDGRMVYCQVSDAYGRTLDSNEVTLDARIKAEVVKQPKSVTASDGADVSFTVGAKGDGLKYQWYYRTAGADTWKKSSCTEATYTTEMKVDRHGRQVYCKVTDEYGNTAKSKTVSMKLPVAKITSQPKSVTISAGETATFSVEATGEGLTYQWYYRSKSDSPWKKSSCTEATYTTEMKADRNGRQVYCKVTDQYGFTAKSDTATMKLPVMKITKQPKSTTKAIGETAKFTVTATGDGLQYQWQYKKAGSDTWKNASSTSDTYSLTVKSSHDGRKFRCKITDAYGNTVKTKTVTLTLDK